MPTHPEMGEQMQPQGWLNPRTKPDWGGHPGWSTLVAVRERCKHRRSMFRDPHPQLVWLGTYSYDPVVMDQN